MFILLEAILALPLIATLVLCGGVVALFGAVYTFKLRQGVSFVWTLAALAAIVFAFFPWVASFGKSFMTVDGAVNMRAIMVTLLELACVWAVGAAVAAVAYWWSFARDVRNRFLKNLERVKEQIALNDSTFSGWSQRSLSLVSKAQALGSRSDNVFLNYSWHLPLPHSVTHLTNRVDPAVLDSSTFTTWNVDPERVNPKKTMGDLVKTTLKTSLTSDGDDASTQETLLAEEEQRVAKNLDHLENALNVALPPKAKFFKGRISYAAAVWPITLVSLLLSDLIRHVVDAVFEYFRGFLDMVSKSAFGDFNVNKA